MGYKLKELPEIAYWQETKQFTIVDDEGKEIEIRVSESSKSYERFMWHEPGGWDEIEDDEINEYLDEQFGDDEWGFENEEKKEREEKMDIIIDDYIQEKGEVKVIDDLISTITRSGIYPRRFKYYEEFYETYYYVKRKLNK